MSSAAFTADGHTNALPPGTRLGEFEIRRVIGVGGFGIVYLAFDHGLEREVAIKEYMPSSLASRTATLHVSLSSPNNEETFKLGLRSFVNEAKLLARFDHRSLIKVHRFWEERGTAYMVMPLLRGRTLREARRVLGPPDEAWLRGVLDPVLGALDVLHREDVYHRDIAPDNILFGDDGVPMLLDFGAARHVIQGRSQSLTAILKPSYAPIEQYGEATNLRQGAWTDLYALGATFHYLLTESPPLPATVRTVSDDAAPLASLPRPGVSENFLRTIDWMLAPRPQDRPQSVTELREVLAGRESVPARSVLPPSSTAWARTEAQLTERPVDKSTGIDRNTDIDLGPLPMPHAGAPVPAPLPTAVPPSAPDAPARPAPEPPAPRARRPIDALIDGDDDAWSASTDRVLPPRPTSLPMPSRSLAPVAAGGAAVVAVAALLFWYFQRGDAAPPKPTPAPVPSSVPASPVPAPQASLPGAEPPAASAPSPAAAPGPVAASAPAPAPTPAPVPAAGPSPAPARPAPAPRATAPAPQPVQPAPQAQPAPAPQPAPGAQRPATGSNDGALRPLPGDGNATAPAPRPSQPKAVVERPKPVLPPSPAPAEPRQGGGTERPNDGALGTVPATGRDPREQCGGRMLLALHKCLVRECVKPQYYDHGECVQVRAIEDRARARINP